MCECVCVCVCVCVCGWGVVVISGCKLLGAETLPFAAAHIGQLADAPVNLQEDRCSVFCNFLSPYEWKSLILLKVTALRIGCPVYFRL